jgi:hypothetical protein
MITAFQPSAFQNNAFQIGVQVAQVAPAQSGGIPRRHRFIDQRKRWLLPNGQMVVGEYEDILELLQTALIEKKDRKKRVRLQSTSKPVVDYVEFKELRYDDIVKIKLLDDVIWKPDPKLFRQALERLLAKMAEEAEEEETVVTLLLLS